MPEIRRTIMNTFKDAQVCQMFVMILKQKWSEFDGKLKDKFTVEDWATKEVLPLRNKFAPKSHTFTCELDARFEFGGT